MTASDRSVAADTAKPDPKGFHIRIDRTDYTVFEEKLTGAELRRVPPAPIPPDRDLFEVRPGQTDLKIKDDDTVQMYDGLRLFTAPDKINPGVESAGSSANRARR